MAWARGTPIVGDLATLRSYLARQDLANLELDGELDLVRDLLTPASDAVRAWLVNKGFDPDRITNLTDYQRIVARFAEATMIRANLLEPPEGREAPESEWDYVQRDLEHVSPEIAAADIPRRHREGIPRVVNLGGSESFF